MSTPPGETPTFHPGPSCHQEDHGERESRPTANRAASKSSCDGDYSESTENPDLSAQVLR